MDKKPKYGVRQVVGFMLRLAWRHRKSVIFVCLAVAAVGVGVSLAQLFVSPEILSRVEGAAPLGELLAVIGGFTALLILLTGLQGYLRDSTLAVYVDLRTRIVSAINSQACTTSYPHTQDEEVIKLRSKATHTTNGNSSPAEHIWRTLTSVLQNVAGFVIYLVLLRDLDPILMAVVIATTVVGFFVSRRINEWGYRHREEESQYLREIYYIRRQAESVEFAKDIRIFGLAGWLRSIKKKSLDLYSAFIARREKVYIWSNVVDVLLGVARNGIAYIYLINLALGEGLSAAQFLLYFTAVSGFTAWITGILGEFSTLHRECVELSAVLEYLNMDEPFRFEGGEPIPPADGWELRLENVTFRYPGADEPTIRSMNLTIHAGERLAVVGLNGAGKTTLVKLLCGFYDPNEGRVTLNGVDIRRFNRREYYKLFSAVFQNYHLLDVTVAENVASAVEGIDLDRVNDCLDKAGLLDKIASLPAGLNTHVGRDVFLEGVLFSGGETQRLMLARALYKDGPLLVLDEPTAALDPIAENNIYMKYADMTAGKTSLFISHRLASTRFCDRIVFLADGAIAEQGTHDELLALGGGYAELFEIQSRYYREEGGHRGENY